MEGKDGTLGREISNPHGSRLLTTIYARTRTFNIKRYPGILGYL